jgi:hypothetical protein
MTVTVAFVIAAAANHLMYDLGIAVLAHVIVAVGVGVFERWMSRQKS